MYCLKSSHFEHDANSTIAPEKANSLAIFPNIRFMMAILKCGSVNFYFIDALCGTAGKVLQTPDTDIPYLRRIEVDLPAEPSCSCRLVFSAILTIRQSRRLHHFIAPQQYPAIIQRTI